MNMSCVGIKNVKYQKRTSYSKIKLLIVLVFNYYFDNLTHF